jgi:hypothetical protein
MSQASLRAVSGPYKYSARAALISAAALPNAQSPTMTNALGKQLQLELSINRFDFMGLWFWRSTLARFNYLTIFGKSILCGKFFHVNGISGVCWKKV